MRIRPTARLLLLAAALSALVALPSTASAAPRSFFGIQGWTPPSAKEFKTLGRGGVGTYRAQLNWSGIEAVRGRYDWSQFDRIVRNAARNRIKVLPYILGSPSWAASRPAYPPSGAGARASYARFVTASVQRYGPGGAFWRANPRLRQRAPRHWQVWNEPNFRGYWYGRPNAREYVDFVRLTRSAIKAGDPGAKIVLAGLPETRLGIPGTRYLKQVYRAGGRSLFDVLPVHPYARNYRGVMGSVIRARRTMRRNGDRRKPIWITEIGWATGGPVSRNTRPFKTSLRGQAKRLKQTFRAVLRNRRRYRIGVMIWFSHKDRRPYAGERNWWAIHTGLFKRSGRPKPAWKVYKRFAP